MVSAISSYWRAFRLIFVLFSLYIMADVFFRWDGFKYYGSLSEFLPSVGLVLILWSFLAFFIAVIVWLTGKAVEWFCLLIGWKIKAKDWLLFIVIFGLLGGTLWAGKRLVFGTGSTLQLKLIVLSCSILIAIVLTLLFRNNLDVIQERITPLVWIFGICTVLSVPLVAYHVWIKQADSIVSQRSPQPFVIVEDRPDIILVTFDALTARNMSAYGYHRPTTPFISEWAKSASLFTRAEAVSNYTSPTTATLMTGKRVWTHQLYHSHGYKPLKSDIQSLSIVLKNNGYYNMAFVVSNYGSVKNLGISNSFEFAPLKSDFKTSTSLFGTVEKSLYQLFGDKIKMYNWILKEDFLLHRVANAFFVSLSRTYVPPKNAFKRFLWSIENFSETQVPPENAFNRLLDVIDNNPPKPFFAWIHLKPPHFPYLPPEPYIGMFDISPEFRTYMIQRNITNRFKREYAEYQDFPQEVQPIVDTLRSRYDEFIRYCDAQFKDFMKQLSRMNKMENTVIILSSDHGESFEHAYIEHDGYHLYEQVTHIPLIIKVPQQDGGRIIDDLVEQTDIPATILDLAYIPVPSWMEGRSLVPLISGRKLPSRPIFSMALQKNPSRGHKITKGTIAVWEGDYKLIHYLEEEKTLLFNLKKDPEELNNLLSIEAEIGKSLLNIIHDKLTKANEKISKEE